MDSWRDAASPQAQDDLDGLLDAALAPAHRRLADRGEFFPFAVALDTSGETGTVMGDPGSGERPSSDEVLDVLIAGLRSDRNTVRAVALVADVRMSDSDAVQVELEHSEGPAMAVYQHYRPRRFRNGVRFEGLIAGVASPSIWS